jgi:hypothetical protein
MTAPTATTLADGKVDLAKFRRDVVDLAVQPPVYYVWAGDWGHGRLAIDVEFTRPVRLDAVEVVLGPFYPNYRASFVVLKGAADEPLAILSDPSPAGRARFVSAPLGTVTRLRAEIYRPEGTTTFSVKGFAFYGQ